MIIFKILPTISDIHAAMYSPTLTTTQEASGVPGPRNMVQGWCSLFPRSCSAVWTSAAAHRTLIFSGKSPPLLKKYESKRGKEIKEMEEKSEKGKIN